MIVNGTNDGLKAQAGYRDGGYIAVIALRSSRRIHHFHLGACSLVLHHLLLPSVIGVLLLCVYWKRVTLYSMLSQKVGALFRRYFP